MMALRGRLSVIAGRSNPPLAAEAARACGVEPSGCEVTVYADGELGVEIQDNVRGNDVFVVQSTSTPVNDALMELLIIIDALKRASASRITAVIPYFGYARQDRKTKPRVPITAKLVCDLIVTAGAHRLMTMDLHAGQIMGFFNIPVDNLYAMPVLVKYLRDQYGDQEICIVSPDAGGVARARAYAKKMDNASLAIVDKRRAAPNEVAEMNIVGNVKGKLAVIIDDMVDTGGTLVKAADALLGEGATGVVACVTHPVLSGSAKEKIARSKLKQLIVTDTIFHQDLQNGARHLRKGDNDWLVQLSVAHLIGEAISRTHEEDSISSLFDVD